MKTTESETPQLARIFAEIGESLQKTIDRNQSNFDLVRVSKSKTSVDIAPNTIRQYAAQGLRVYKMGKATFFSKKELESFIREKSQKEGFDKYKPMNPSVQKSGLT